MSEQRPVYTLTTKPAVLASYDEAIEAARSLAPRLHDRIAETEELRRLPDSTVRELLQSGLCGLMQPKQFGGSELGAEAMIDVTIELALECASTAWVYMLWTAHAWLQALWPPEAQEEMWANPNTLASSVTHTSGDVIATDGGFIWTGKGFFSSGVDHCNWLTASVQVQGKDSNETPDRYWLLIPREDLEVEDDWYTIGLRGTGSKTIVANHVFIPIERTLASGDAQEGNAPGRKINNNPMYAGIVPANFGAAMAAPAIGAARALLESSLQRLATKVNKSDRPDVKRPYDPAVDLGVTFARFASAAAELDSARLLLLHNVRDFSRIPADQVSREARARCRRNIAFVAQKARTVAHTLFAEAGGSAVYANSELQRAWHDANVAASHHALTWDWQGGDWTKVVLGQPPSERPSD